MNCLYLYTPTELIPSYKVIPYIFKRAIAYLMDMVRIFESRHLETLKCYYNEPLDVFVFHCAGKKITIQYASPEQIASIFRKAHVKDSSLPLSGREKTYIEMVAGIIDGSDTECAIWSNYIDFFFETADNLRRSRIPVNENS